MGPADALLAAALHQPAPITAVQIQGRIVEIMNNVS
jgi:hypothetical protein